MKDQTVFTNKIIKSSYWGTDVSSLHHVVRKTDFATITLMNLNSIDTSWSTDFAEKWRFTFHSNDDRAWINYSEEEWTALHKIGFGCSAFRTDMWVWISAQTPNGIQYIMEDANDNAPDTGGWQVYDS